MLLDVAPIDTSFLKPFVVGAIRTVQNFCGVEASLVSITPAAKAERHAVDIAGVIGITGKHFRGAMMICFPKATFLGIMNRMIKEDHQELTPDLDDGAAELTNIIFGQAKTALNQAGHEIQMAMPSVIKGDLLESGCPTSTRGDICTLETPDGKFFIEFAGEEELPPKALPQRESGDVPKLNAHVMMSFVEGVRKTLQTQCGATTTAGTPFLKKPEKDFRFDVGGMIGFTGATFGGTFGICFEKKAFLGLVEKMTGEKHDKISQEIEDAAAELVNIVFGSVKKVLNAEGHQMRAAIPTIIRGHNVQSLYPAQRVPIVLPFELFGGQFWIEFAFAESQA